VPKGKWHGTEGLSKDKLQVLYCYDETCHLAAEAAVALTAQGFRVIEMEGGFSTWEARGYPVVASQPKAA
jgi:rhodanese-related sulfurtransferase